ncbi:myosin-binding protein 2-like [Hibiscus syriacus]|nr:myosin-binding protein 2-like [Hibiscus syriacus]
MAMILRLQEEKAAIEMEAKQYRRTIEAKSAYDAEEMNILKEIIIRREREKYFLEKEVEACVQMLYGNEQLEADTYDIAVMNERGTSSEEQGPLPIQQFSLQITELNETAGNEAYMFRSDDENLNRQERHVDEKRINATEEEEEERCGESNPDQRLTPKTTEPNIVFPYNNETMEKGGEGLHGSGSGFNCRVLDVHVVSGASNLDNKEGEKRIDKEPKTSDNQTIIEPCRTRNSLDRSEGLPPLGPSQPKSLHRKSRSAFDYERSKIDNEVGWLRERLKIVQLGREKLNLPAGHREKEQVELQILEDIVSQLREDTAINGTGEGSATSIFAPSII